MKFVLATLFSVFLSFLVFSAIPFQKEIDSLSAALKSNYKDKTQIELYNKKSVSYRHQGKFRLALDYGFKAEKLASKTNNTQGLIESYEQISAVYRELKKYDRAIQYLDKERELCLKNKDLIAEGNVYDQIGHIYYAKGDTLAAINNHLLSLKTRIKSDDLYGQGNSYNSIAQIYSAQNNLTKAAHYFQKELAVFLKIGTEKSRIAQAAGNAGLIFYWQSNRKAAIHHFQTALRVYQEINNIDGMLWIYRFLGTIYSDAGDYENTYRYLDKALTIAKERGLANEIADSYRHLISLYIKIEQYDKAAKLVVANIEIYRKNGNAEAALAESHNQLAIIYLSRKNYSKAIVEFQNSMTFAEKSNNKLHYYHSAEQLANIYIFQKKYDLAKPLLQHAIKHYKSTDEVERVSSCYKSLSKVYEQTGDYKRALENINQHIYFDSIYSKNTSEFEKEVFRLNTENKYLKDKILKENKANILAVNLKKSEIQRKSAFAGVVILLILGLLFYYLLRLRIKKSKVDQKLIEVQKNENKLIRETEQFKSQFLINMSHELRTPLTLINGHLEVLKKENGFEENKHVNEIQRNGKQLLKLINDILDLAKAESGKYKLSYKKGDIINETKAILQSFHSYAETHEIQYTSEFDIPNKEDFNNSFIYSSEVLNIVLINLLSNAFKYTPDGGQISINLSVKNGLFYVSVSDNGVGIPEEHLPKVFDRFYQVDGIHQRAYDSTGIGLSLAKELTLLHGGDIAVKANELGGCIFTFWLKEATAISDNFMSTETPEKTFLETEPETTHLINQNELPLILIVEDQPDLREFIVSNLSQSYQCITAKNGVEGIEMANKFIPDLIVSDIMMPEMNGNVMCQKLKEAELTSHIPIILLTAKAEQENIIEGLSVGANDYLTKPFSVNELALRINNQIETIRKIQNRFQADKIPTIEDLSTAFSNQKDVDFLERLYQIIENNIDNNQLGVDFLADQIALSASQLSRKLKSISGLTPAILIKDIRMKKAVELLKKGESVSDVAWSVGFESPAYFGKVFKAHFGFAPSDSILK